MENLPAKTVTLKSRRSELGRLSRWAGCLAFVGGISFLSTSALNRTVAIGAKQEKMAADMDLLKRIVSSLVPTVRGIEVGGTTSEDESSSEARTIQVKVSRANLRSAPSIDAELLISVAQGAVLVEHERAGSWIRTTAPTGQDAWISADLVEPAASLG